MKISHKLQQRDKYDVNDVIDVLQFVNCGQKSHIDLFFIVFDFEHVLGSLAYCCFFLASVYQLKLSTIVLEQLWIYFIDFEQVNTGCIKSLSSLLSSL